MEEKMIHGLSIPLAHTTTINYNDMRLPEIVHSKDKQKRPPSRNLRLPNTLPRERRDIITKKTL
jgi:hypothetical protein